MFVSDNAEDLSVDPGMLASETCSKTHHVTCEKDTLLPTPAPREETGSHQSVALSGEEDETAETVQSSSNWLLWLYCQ